MNQITEEHRRIFEQAVEERMQRTGAVGIAAAIVDPSGETQYQHFFGLADREKGMPINEDTIFGVASVSKSFVAVSIMQLFEQGLLSLDAPVSRYIPEFRPQQNRPVLIRHLMSHSAGFFPVPRTLLNDTAASLGRTEEADGDLSFLQDVNQEGVRRVTEQLNALTPGHGLIGTPGQYMSYSNDGFGLLSEVVRRVSGSKTFAQYLRTHVLDPLGMTRSGADYLRPRLDGNACARYSRTDGEITGTHDFYDFAFALPGAGAVNSTLADLKRYVTMYLNRGKTPDGRRILSSDSVRSMCRPRVMENDRCDYGFGLSIKRLDDLKVVGHSGSQPGVSSQIIWSYGAGGAVIVLCNTSGGQAGWIANAAMRMYHGRSPLPPEDGYAPVTWSQKTMEGVCGRYRNDEFGAVTWEFSMKDGELQLTCDGVPAQITPVQEDICFYRLDGGDEKLIFHFDDNGKVFALRSGSRMVPRIDD